jgi:hypothetical protein
MSDFWSGPSKPRKGKMMAPTFGKKPDQPAATVARAVIVTVC